MSDEKQLKSENKKMLPMLIGAGVLVLLIADYMIYWLIKSLHKCNLPIKHTGKFRSCKGEVYIFR